MKNEDFNALVDLWETRAHGQQLKPGTVKHQRACLEFFLGAHALAAIQGDENGVGPVLMLLSVGRPLEKRPTAAAPAPGA